MCDAKVNLVFTSRSAPRFMPKATYDETITFHGSLNLVSKVSSQLSVHRWFLYWLTSQVISIDYLDAAGQLDAGISPSISANA